MTREKGTMEGKTLIIGAGGQIGIELTLALRTRRGSQNVIATDIRIPEGYNPADGPFFELNALDKAGTEAIIKEHGITEVFQLAALLSATSEKFPEKAWELNMVGLFNILELAKEYNLRVFWPSSIAAFGPNTPKNDTPQYTIMEPSSVYGISKLSGERWCEYYHKKFGVDVRSIRYPGLIGYRSEPGGGTTDYAVDIFYHAVEKGEYNCFLAPHTMLPMMMMDDAIRATISIMEAPFDSIRIRSSYNLSGLSFTPQMLAAEIQTHLPDFSISYAPDFRQQLADSWPNSINDSAARADWGWQPEFDLHTLVHVMLREVRKKKSTSNVTSQ